MKPLRLILPITLFILSAVFAWVASITNLDGIKIWCYFMCMILTVAIIPALVWSLD